VDSPYVLRGGKKVFKRVLARVLVVVAVTSGVAVVPSVAHAIPDIGGSGCWSIGCDGIDPTAVGCDRDAITIDRAQVWMSGGYYMTAELRHSPKCGSVWVRTGYLIYVYVERQSPYRMEHAHGANAVNWSRMVGARGYWTRACLQVPYGGTFCSNWNGLSA